MNAARDAEGLRAVLAQVTHDFALWAKEERTA